METDTNFRVTRGNGASKANRPARAAKVLPEDTAYVQWPALQSTLESLSESRPEAVTYAKALIADPDYPSEETQERLAAHLAAQLTSETDPLPN